MPKFKFILQREVVETDEVTRIIEADDINAANAIAEEMCEEFNSSCPDDTQPIAGGDCQDWFVNVGYEARPEDAEPARQCECFNCGWSGDEDALKEIEDFHSRVEAGDTTVLAGECPECGCLAYLKDDGEPCEHYWGGSPSPWAECLRCGTQCEERVNADGSQYDEPVHVPGLNEALAPMRDEGDTL